MLLAAYKIYQEKYSSTEDTSTSGEKGRKEENDKENLMLVFIVGMLGGIKLSYNSSL